MIDTCIYAGSLAGSLVGCLVVLWLVQSLG
jgi:hypothetical protein